ncbi:MAG TPA: hypothetical protein VN774_09860 [Candidatus Limnocylindrales bacterium]|nr:hypothetical protein [Candidatus Limnocylindrales bacterium]
MMRRVVMQHFRSRRFSPHRLVSCAILSSLLAAPACFGNTQQDRLPEFKERFEREGDPVRKAKDLVNLGNLQVLEFVHAAAADNFDLAFSLLTEYRNEVRTTFDLLKATGNDAERKPEGFKQLQIHLRKSLWEMDRVMPRITPERHATFEDIQHELGRIHNDLIHMLFPREPGSRKSNENPEN